jgi:hypothetical protein
MVKVFGPVPLTLEQKRLRPRKNYDEADELALIVWDGQRLMFVDTGEVHDATDLYLATKLPKIGRAILVGFDINKLLARVIQLHEPSKQFQAYGREIETVQRNRKTGTYPRNISRGFTFTFVGWRDGKRKQYATKIYPLDPFSFVPQPRNKTRGNANDVAEFGKDLRSFLQANRLPMRPTTAGIASMLLRDARFWTGYRRKVPSTTNEIARPVLIGQFYRNAYKGRKALPEVWQLDQRRSHHVCAAEIDLPDGDDLFAHGLFRNADDVWVDGAHPRAQHFLNNHFGLFRARVKIPNNPNGLFPHFDSPGSRVVYFTSNEWPTLAAAGIELEYLVASWTARRRDEGMKRYARWAIEQLDAASPERSQWLKPLLLAPYGLLGTTPRPLRAAFLQGNGKERNIYLGFGHSQVFKTTSSKHDIEPAFVNVIWRGMIERETRRRTIVQAQRLERAGADLIRLDADAIYFRPNPSVLDQFDADRWKLVVHSHVAVDGRNFVSDQIPGGCLPGLAGVFRSRTLGELNEARRATRRVRRESDSGEPRLFDA